MIGKIISAKSFGSTVGYVMKDGCEILYLEGITPSDAKEMARDFQDQALLNPRIKNAVGHISLSFSEKDKAMLTDKVIAAIARDYLRRMGIENTQVLIVRHTDTAHPHCHIVYNRVNNDGKTISDSNIKLRNMKVCDELTTEYNLYRPQQKENVNRDKLREPDRTKYEIYDVISKNLRGCKGWDDFTAKLSREGISVRFKEKGKTGIREGVLFSKNGHTFSGSRIDKQFSYSKLDSIFNPKQAASPKLDMSKPTVTKTATTQITSNPKFDVNQRQAPQYSESSKKGFNDAVGNYKGAFNVFSVSGGSAGDESLDTGALGGGSLPVPHMDIGIGLSPDMMQRMAGESHNEHIARITALINSISAAMLAYIEEQKRRQKETAKNKSKGIKF